MYDTFYTHIPAIRYGLFCLWFLWVVSYVMEVTDLSKHCSDWNIEAVRAEMEKKTALRKAYLIWVTYSQKKLAAFKDFSF